MKLIVLLSFLIWPAAITAQHTYNSNAKAENMVGRNFPAASFITCNGNVWNSQQLKGKVTLVNFWFTTCRNCLQEIPYLVALKDTLSNESFSIVSFARNTEGELIHFFRKKYLKQSFPLIPYDIIPTLTGTETRSSLLHDSLHVNAYPLTYITDKNGVIRYASTGFPEEGLTAYVYFHKLRSLIDQLMKE